MPLARAWLSFRCRTGDCVPRRISEKPKRRHQNVPVIESFALAAQIIDSQSGSISLWQTRFVGPVCSRYEIRRRTRRTINSSTKHVFDMSTELQLPNIGEGVEEAEVAEILVSAGDTIDANQIVMELETEKAVVELPCPYPGKIEQILVEAGDVIRVGQSLLVVSDAAPAAASPDSSSHSEEQGIPAPALAIETPPADEQPPEPAAERDVAEPVPSQPVAAPIASTTTEMVTGAFEFHLPALGEGVESADVAEVMVSVGEVIPADAVVMELETEKAVVELPCPHPGKITQIHVSVGDTIPVGALVLSVETADVVADAPRPGETAPAESTVQPEVSGPSPRRGPAPPVTATLATKQDSPGDPVVASPIPAAPSTRRLARQLGVDLRDVNGSGRGGRIIAEDVQAFVREQLDRPTLPATTRGGGEITVVSGSIAPPPLPDFSKFGLVERERMNKIARTAAENLTVSWNVIPHVTQHDQVDITDLEAARKRFTQGVGQQGPKVTMTAIVIKALAKCLQVFPKFNSSLDPETSEIVYKRFFNIGCAVDTPNGLLVPVIKNCDQKSILEIAADITELAELARDRKLPVESMQGATCTLTNLGGIGGVGFTPIVNYPEVCILGMSRGQKELRIIDGEIQERLILPVSLSYDHRVINGADAARFVVTLCNLLRDPFQLLATV